MAYLLSWSHEVRHFFSGIYLDLWGTLLFAYIVTLLIIAFALIGKAIRSIFR
jgi:hypothetical protein